MRVITGSIFAIFWACVHAGDIASLEKFKEEYAKHLRTSSAHDANAGIVGVALPSEAGLQPLWRWYRTVDASTKGLAKQVMDEAGSSQPLANSAMALAEFKTVFETDLKAFDTAGDLKADNAVKKWPLVAAVLGDAEPTGATGKLAWKAYHALGADSQALAKTQIMESKFVEVFKTNWQAEVTAVAPTSYGGRMAMRANTMNSVAKTFDGKTLEATKGKVSNELYTALSASLGERLVRIMG
jgi:hypothetical protein